MKLYKLKLFEKIEKDSIFETINRIHTKLSVAVKCALELEKERIRLCEKWIILVLFKQGNIWLLMQ